MKKQYLSVFLAFWLLLFTATSMGGSPLTSLTSFTTEVDGNIIYAATWNTTIGSLYTWITNTLIPNLNVVTTLGDLYVCNSGGSSLARLGVGANGNVLTADSTKALGLAWETVVNSTYLTTKGDITGYSTAAGRVPVGTNGYVLTADSTQPFGFNWESAGASAVPSGTITAYNSSYAGNTIPSGWVICDGNNSTPNLIGMFILGGQPSTGSSSANSSGFGNQTVNAVYSANVTHSHTYSGTTSAASAAVANCTAGAGNVVSQQGHSHSYSGTTSSQSSAPACYVLCYIMKL